MNSAWKIICLSFLLWTVASLPAKNKSYAISVYLSEKDEKIAVKTFIAKTNKISKFMSSNQSILFVADHPNSPTGNAYSYTSIALLNSKVNVIRTDSLITPFLGYLIIHYKIQNNNECGDINKEYGYSTYSGALAYKGKCLSYYFIRETKLVFAYQNNKWVFKDAIQLRNDGVFVERELPDFILTNAFGYGENRLRENIAWEKLID